MKILLLGFPVLKKAFLQSGHDVLTCTTDQCGDLWVPEFPVCIDQIVEALPSEWSPDLVLLMDESSEPMFLGLEHLDVPLAWYTIDAHLHLHWHRDYAAVFDFIFVAQRDYLADYTIDQGRQVVQWLPLFSNPEIDRKASLEKIYDLSFVGAMNIRWKPERSRFLEAVNQRFPLYMSSGDYVCVFNRSKVVLNQCAANDVNFRIFEALACGSCLLTEHVGNGFEELFNDRQHLVVYQRGNIDQVVDLAYYYGSHKDEREAIAEEGRQAVQALHTTQHRVQTIVHTIQIADVHALVSRRKSQLSHVHTCLDHVYAHAEGVYELASRRYQSSPSKFRECVRTAQMYRSVRSNLRQSVREKLTNVETINVT